jgi:hypothetical protein
MIVLGLAAVFALTLVTDGAAAADPEIEELKRQVEQLKRRIEQLEGERQRAPAPAVAAPRAEGKPPTTLAEVGTAPEAGEAPGEEDSTGTDPRSFGTKFMPYYRYERLENDVKVDTLALFGLVRIDDNIAWTYELPVAKKIDYSSVSAFKSLPACPPAISGELPGSPGGGFPNNGVPFSDLDCDGDVMGIGDLGLRLFVKNERLRFDSPFRDGSGEWMLGFETLLPTANEDVLGGEAWVLSPLVTLVMDMPLPYSFMALMNFYDFDVTRDSSRDNISRFRGRWFYMQPLTPPDKGWWGGIYLLPEFQPVYDFERSEFSFWIGPELGKILAPGRIVYLKPGWGIDSEDPERDFTFEAGFRWFFD